MPAIEFWLAPTPFFIAIATALGWIFSITNLSNRIPKTVIIFIAALCVLGTWGCTTQQEQTLNEMAGNFNAMKNRHLTAEQTEKIITAAQNICPIEPTINVATNLSDAEAVAYAHEFVKTFQSAGCLSKLNEGWNPVGAITDVHIFVQQKTYENMHKGAKQLYELFNQVDIDIKPLYIGPDNTLMKEHPFVLAVGANPRK